MRQGMSTALIAAAAAMVTAAYYARVPNRGTQSGAVGASVSAIPGTAPLPKTSTKSLPCKAYTDAPDGVVDASSYGDGLKLWKQFEQKEMMAANPGVRYVIALAPDPIHTQLSLYFDRTMEAIQAAAQDEHYVYDSSWLPWKLDGKSYPIRADEDTEEAAVEGREECPGLLLFRYQGGAQQNADTPYSSGLAVFVVGDEPTKGVNAEEWNKAMELIRLAGGTAGPLRILGPTFSGSLPSLERLLAEPATKNGFQQARIYSGAVWSCDSISHFQSAEAPTGKEQESGAKMKVDFGVFSENSERQIYRLLMYFRSQHQSLTDIAILSEDETAYGSTDTSKPVSSSADPCNFDYGKSDVPLWLFYPRDISAVRAAYLEQSIFSRGNGAGAQSRGPLTVLHPAATVVPSSETDTITTYAGDEVSLDEDSYLYELVNFLRSHHTHYLVLRCSNPDDFLFLTRFFHHTYPEGRIITLGSDELFRREVDTSEFRGVVALTNYPLLPREQHWTRLINSPDLSQHVHRIFAADTIESEYLAARFIFDLKDPKPVVEATSSGYPYPLKMEFKVIFLTIQIQSG